MERFVTRRRMWPVLRLFSRGPLVRAIDRVEAAVVMLAALVVVTAAACAGALGTMVHDARVQTYIEQAKTRHPVLATAVEDSKNATTPDTPDTPETPEATTSTVYARWQANGIDRAGVLSWDEDVKAGDQLHIWVDADGNRVSQPSPISRAATDAVSVAMVAWLSVVLAVTGVVSAVRSHTRCTRDTLWERELRCLFEGEGCTNSPQ